MVSRRVRKGQSVLLSGIMALSLVLPAISVNAASDIDGHWAAKEMQSLVQKGIISGYPDGTFKPDNTITRAEFTSILDHAAGLKDVTATGFSDVSASDWFSGAVGAAVKAGYVSGYPDGTFHPNATISRQEAATMLSGLLHLDKNQSGAAPFADQAQIASWALPNVMAAVQAGAISGYPDGSFGPAKGMTRAETVVMISRVLGSLTGTVNPTDNPQQPGAVTQVAKVTDTNGSAAADVSVNIFPSGKKTPLFTGMTNASGEVSAQLEPGDYDVTAARNGQVAYQSASVGATPSSWTIALAQSATITGQVVDADGKPVAHALVIASRQGSFYTLSDSSGNYSLQVLPNGNYQLRVVSDSSLSSTLSDSDIIKQLSKAVDLDSSQSLTSGTAKLYIFNDSISVGGAGTSMSTGQLGLKDDGPSIGNTSYYGNGGGHSNRNTNSNSSSDVTLLNQGGTVNNSLSLYNTNGVYGPTSGTAVVNGNVTIAADRVTLQNTSIQGDLIVDASVPNDFTANHVIVSGRTIVNGGSPNTVRFMDSTLFNVDINKPGVRLFLGGDTITQAVYFNTNAMLDLTTIFHSGSVQNVFIQPGTSSATFQGDGSVIGMLTVQTPVELILGTTDTIPGVQVLSKGVTIKGNGGTQIDRLIQQFDTTLDNVTPAHQYQVTIEGASAAGPNPDAILDSNGCIPGIHSFIQGTHMAFAIDVQSTDPALPQSSIQPEVQIFTADSNPTLVKTLPMEYSAHPPTVPDARHFWAAGLQLTDQWATGDYTYRFVVNGKYVFTPDNHTFTVKQPDTSVVNAVYDASAGVYAAPTDGGKITFVGASTPGANPDAIIDSNGCVPGNHTFGQNSHVVFAVDIQSTDSALSSDKIKPVLQIFTADAHPTLVQTIEMAYGPHPPTNPNAKHFWTGAQQLTNQWATGDYTYQFVVNGKYVFTPENHKFTIQ